MNSENYSAISPQTVGRLRSTVLEFLRFWMAWRRHLCSGSHPCFRPGTSKKRVKKTFSRAAGFLLKSCNQQSIFITNYLGE
jgi:hypothetical protein